MVLAQTGGMLQKNGSIPPAVTPAPRVISAPHVVQAASLQAGPLPGGAPSPTAPPPGASAPVTLAPVTPPPVTLPPVTLPPGAPASAVVTLADYPLAPGATWLYRTYDTIDTGEHGVAEERGSLTVRTLAVHRHGDLTVATLETRRVVNAETDTQISWQVIETGAAPAGEPAAPAPARVHTIAEVNRLRQILDGGASTLRASDADLAFPIRTGALWGDERLLARGDGLYVNRVEAPVEVEVPAGRLKAWPIVFATLPERITTWFSPGVGVVRYEYAHNGSLSRESYELLEFRRGAADTLALVRYLDGVVHRLTDYPDFWPIRASLAEDAELRALLGPLTVVASGELPDGTRRHLLEGDGTTLSFAQLPEGRAPEGRLPEGARATVVEWRNRAGLIHAFGAVDPRAAHPGPRGS